MGGSIFVEGDLIVFLEVSVKNGNLGSYFY